MIMIDKGASHCFIAEHVARKLNWDIEPTSRFSVVLGDGTCIHAGGVCKKVPLVLDSELFHISCCVSPQQCRFDFGNIMARHMEFSVERRQKCLRGDPSLTRKASTFCECQSLEAEDESWLLWAMNGEELNEQVSTGKGLSATAPDELAAVFAEFPSVSAPSAGLPPVCTSDHRIVLQPGARPLSVWPYCYNHL